MKGHLLLSSILLLGGCTATGPGDGPAAPIPTGWIYGHAASSNRTVRVNARTGQAEEVAWPHPPVRQDAFLWEGNISPVDGDLAGFGDTGWGWPRTFVLDAITGEYRDFDPPVRAVETDFRWSPDGTQVLFLRRGDQSNSYNRLVRLTVATGMVNTILESDHAAGILSKPFWIGADSVGVSVDERPRVGAFPHHYLRIALSTGAVAPFDDVQWGQFHIPLISADQEWVAHWVDHDSLLATGDQVLFISLRVRNRTSGSERTMWSFPAATTYVGSTSIAFSPDSRFIASCQTDTEVTIFSVATASVVSRWPHPYCDVAINWSWGPEGPPTP